MTGENPCGDTAAASGKSVSEPDRLGAEASVRCGENPYQDVPIKACKVILCLCGKIHLTAGNDENPVKERLEFLALRKPVKQVNTPSFSLHPDNGSVANTEGCS